MRLAASVKNLSGISVYTLNQLGEISMKAKLEHIANYCYERAFDAKTIESNHYWLNMMVVAIAAKKRL